METGLFLPLIARETLLPTAERVARLREALPMILATVEGESDDVALQATLACLLYAALPQAIWCGFYRRVGESTLAVGPYQGTLGCLRIEFSRGVCGAAARTQTTQRIDDVNDFPDHIACDGRSRSEVVVPVCRKGNLLAVLDIDSPHLAAFSPEETALLEELVATVFDPR